MQNTTARLVTGLDKLQPGIFSLYRSTEFVCLRSTGSEMPGYSGSIKFIRGQAAFL